MLGTGRLAVMTIFAVLVLAHTAWAEPTEIPDRPPRLTFDKHVDYVAWYNDFVRRGRDEKDNAYPLYLKLCPDKDGKGGFPKPEGKAAEQFDKAVGRVWTREEFPELAAYLKELQPAFALFEEAGQKSDYWEPANPDGMSALEIVIPVTVESRRVLKAWDVQSWEADFRTEKNIRLFCASALRFASCAEQNATAINGLIALQCRCFAYHQLLSGFGDRVLKPRESKSLLKLFQRLDRGDFSWDRCIIVEWAFCLDGIQLFSKHTSTDPELKAKLKALFKTAEIDESVILDTPPDLNFAVQFAEMHFPKLIKAAKRYRSSRKSVERLRDIETRASQQIRDNLALKCFIPKLERAGELSLRTESLRRGVLIVLALNAHYDKHGNWPKSLKAIDKKLGLKGLRKIVIDPYSDKPLIYKLRDRKPLLYSVGVDGKDDGGVHHAKFGDGATGPADFVFWPYQKPETK